MYRQLKQRKMKGKMLSVAIILVVGFTACTNQNNSNSQAQKDNLTVKQIKEDMKSFIAIFEIPANRIFKSSRVLSINFGY